ncbi:MAG TPA: penicillin-binding transpeptidase domain-containing protein [Chitinophagaceae bacterium]|jgi:beta-lactamase class D
MQRPLLYLIAISFYFVSCSPNNVKEDDSLKTYFDSAGVSGCFGMFDNGQGNFTIYNLARFRDSVYTPASTFKIVNSLVGIETGRVKDDSTVFKYDSTLRGRDECNTDMSMYTAFRLSCPPFYRQLARRIGKDTMQYWLDTLGYASKKGRFVIKNNLDTFWLDNSMKITADEELGLVKKLYFDQLPFQKRSQQIVRRMMLWESNSNYKLSYKTGWGNLENGHNLGWIVGWVEENNHPYFFVLQLESANPHFDMRTARLALLKTILKRLGFFEGRK